MQKKARIFLRVGRETSGVRMLIFGSESGRVRSSDKHGLCELLDETVHGYKIGETFLVSPCVIPLEIVHAMQVQVPHTVEWRLVKAKPYVFSFESFRFALSRTCESLHEQAIANRVHMSQQINAVLVGR